MPRKDAANEIQKSLEGVRGGIGATMFCSGVQTLPPSAAFVIKAVRLSSVILVIPVLGFFYRIKNKEHS